jgi:hypothetical protein
VYTKFHPSNGRLLPDPGPVDGIASVSMCTRTVTMSPERWARLEVVRSDDEDSE